MGTGTATQNGELNIEECRTCTSSILRKKKKRLSFAYTPSFSGPMTNLSEFTETSLRRLYSLRTFGPSFADLLQIYNGQNMLWKQSIAATPSIESELEISKGNWSKLKSCAFDETYPVDSNPAPCSNLNGFCSHMISGYGSEVAK